MLLASLVLLGLCCPCLRLVVWQGSGCPDLVALPHLLVALLLPLLPLLRALPEVVVWGLVWLGLVWVPFGSVLPPVVVLELIVAFCMLCSVVP